LFRARPLPQSHNQPPAVQPSTTAASRRGSSSDTTVISATGTTTALGLAGVPKELLAALAQDPEGAALLEQIRAFPDVDVGAILAASSDDGSGDSASTCSSEEFNYAAAASATDGDAPLTNGHSGGHSNGHSNSHSDGHSKATAVLPALRLPESSSSGATAAARAATDTTTAGVHSGDTVNATALTAAPVHDNSSSSSHYAVPHTAGALSSSRKGSASSVVAPPRRRRSSSGSVMETASAGTPRSASALGAMLEAGCGMLDRQQEWERQRKRRLSEVTAAQREQVSLPRKACNTVLKNTYRVTRSGVLGNWDRMIAL
jgi:hypothetical protein